MNHKRKRPRNQRAGCKMCKPWKINGTASRRWLSGYSHTNFEKWSDAKRRYTTMELLEEYLSENNGAVV